MWRTIANAAYFYRLRVRSQPVQEMLAGLGIAVGVALFFAVQVASSSITGSMRELTRNISGEATIEVVSRNIDGMDQQVAVRAAQLPGVSLAAPVLEQRTTVGGPAGRSPMTILGADERLDRLGGAFVQRFAEKQRELDSFGLFVARSVAARAGVEPGDQVTIESKGTARTAVLAGVLTKEDVGPLADAAVSIAPLGLTQRLTGSQGKISRVIIATSGPAGPANLEKEFGSRFNVRPIDSEADLLGAALSPDRQSSALVSAIAMLIGLLFAYNAMLLVITGRRRQVAELRLLGADRRTVMSTLVFETCVLGLTASVAGVIMGDVLSRVAFDSVPEYISAGFAVSGQRVVEPLVVFISILGGLAATTMAYAIPAVQLLRTTPGGVAESMENGSRIGAVPVRKSAGIAGLGLVLAATGLAVLMPAWSPIWVVLGMIGLIALAALLWVAVLSGLVRLVRLRGGGATNVAVLELSGRPVRALALALIAAGAMAATLSIGGAKLDLQRGVDRLTSDYFKTSQLWLLPADPVNVFQTQRFDPRTLGNQPEDLDLIANSRVFQWEFFDFADRRLLLIVPPSTLERPLVSSQVRDGDWATASDRIQRGGWIALSSSVADHLGIAVGDHVNLPTPRGLERFRLAATTANHGWPSGSAVIGARDYERAWGTESVSAIGVNLKPGVSETEARRVIERGLTSRNAIIIRTPAEMVEDKTSAFVQGLSRLSQLSTMVLAASILAIVAAMFAAVWQRRRRLASLRAIGMSRADLGRSLWVETTLVVALGGLAGIPIGIYGQLFGSRWTEIATDYDAPFHPAIGYGLKTLIGMLLLTSVATLVPVYLASRVAPDIDDNEHN